MARKKRKPDGDRPKRPADLPDRRAMDGVMHQFVGPLQRPADHDTPLARAQALVYRAFEETNERWRVQLAKEALAVCPDCADACVLLAEHARSRKEALRLYEQGVAAGERALGPKAFQDEVGRFWGVIETRPYMRARLGLAHSLWTAGRRDEAVRHLQDMLRLNPGDNQGVRYTLAGFLLFLDRDDDLARLLQQYPDEASAAWAYTKALLAFRRHGDTPEARRLLKEARKTNKHVPAYLLGEKFPSPEEAGHYSPGDESEALNYIGSFLAAWKSTPGAVAWLRENVEGKKVNEGPSPRGPLGFIKKWLNKNLPQEYDVWQADFRQTPNWIRIDGKPVRPWVVLVTSRSTDLILAHEMPGGDAHGGAAVGCAGPGDAAPGGGRTASAHRIAGPGRRALGGVEAAPGRDRRRPGRGGGTGPVGCHLPGNERTRLRQAPAGPARHARRYASAGRGVLRGGGFVLPASSVEEGRVRGGDQGRVRQVSERPVVRRPDGTAGLSIGLALYEDLKALRRLWASDRDDEDNARRTVATSVTFGEEWDVPVADLEAARRYGWRVARPDAYPEVLHKERGLAMRPPLAWELELMEACLRAVPDFVTRRKQDDPAREETTVPAASEELRLVLSWVVENET